jgi:hypothetical protein
MMPMRGVPSAGLGTVNLKKQYNGRGAGEGKALSLQEFSRSPAGGTHTALEEQDLKTQLCALNVFASCVDQRGHKAAACVVLVAAAPTAEQDLCNPLTCGQTCLLPWCMGTH